MATIELFHFPLSGNSQKVRLFLSLLGLAAEIRPVDLAAGQQRTAEFRALNPFGEVPVLRDGDHVIRDSQAILVYLARRYGDPAWLPLDPVAMARVMEWLMVAENELIRGPALARVIRKFGRDGDLDTALAVCQHVLAAIEDHLTGRDWLAAAHPTIADIACFPYLALAHEGGLDLDGRPAIRAWIGRVAALPGYVAVPGTEGAAPA